MSWLGSAFKWLGGALVAAMKWIVCSVIEAFLYWLKVAFETAFAVLPDPWEQWIADYSGSFFKWYQWGDKWLPLSEMLTLILLYYGWLVVCAIGSWAFRMLRG